MFRHLCFRIRLINEKVFSKCRSFYEIWITTLLIDVAKSKSFYKSKFVWKNLQRNHVIKNVSLTHERENSILNVYCRRFFVNTSKQTIFFLKKNERLRKNVHDNLQFEKFRCEFCFLHWRIFFFLFQKYWWKDRLFESNFSINAITFECKFRIYHSIQKIIIYVILKIDNKFCIEIMNC